MRKHFILSKTYNVANEINRDWCINVIQSNLSGSICEILFRPNLSLSSQICHSSLSTISNILHEICCDFSQKFHTFQKTWNSFACKCLSILSYWTLLILGVVTTLVIDKPLSTNPKKWSSTLKQFVCNSWKIIWGCFIILWGWHLKD